MRNQWAEIRRARAADGWRRVRASREWELFGAVVEAVALVALVAAVMAGVCALGVILNPGM
jgi:hypothetical protein